MNKSRTLSTKDTYCTPEKVLERVWRVGPIILDPMTNPTNPTRAARFAVSPDDFVGGWVDKPGMLCDGLSIDWLTESDGGLTFVNPPFVGVLKKAALTLAGGLYRAGGEAIVLVPANVGAGWFQDLCSPRLSFARAVCYLRGRLTFLLPSGVPVADPAMFDVAMVYYGSRVGAFGDAFADLGDVDAP